MNKTRLEHAWGIIPNTSGKPFDSGNFNFGPCWTMLRVFQEKLELNKPIDSTQSSSYNMLEMIVGLIHGFCKISTLLLYLRVETRFFGISRLWVFTCKSLNSS